MTTALNLNGLMTLPGAEVPEKNKTEVRSFEFVESPSALLTSPSGSTASLRAPSGPVTADPNPTDRPRVEATDISTETGPEKGDVGPPNEGRSKAVLFSVERLLRMQDPDIGRHRQLPGHPYHSPLPCRSTNTLLPGHRWPVNPTLNSATELPIGICETQADDEMTTTLTSSSSSLTSSSPLTSSFSHRGYRSSPSPVLQQRLGRHRGALALPSALRPSHYFQGMSPSRGTDEAPSSLPVESSLFDWCLVTSQESGGGLHGHRYAPYPLSRYPHRGTLDASASAFLATSEVEVDRGGVRGERDSSGTQRVTTTAPSSFARYRRTHGTAAVGGGGRQQDGTAPCIDVDAAPPHVTNDLQRIERMVRGLEHRHQHAINNTCTDLVF